MRYFRYKNTNENKNNALREHYKSLSKNERRIFRKEKWWSRFSITVTFVVFFACIVAGILLLKSIPLPQAWFLRLLVYIAKVLIGAISLIGGGFLAVLLTTPLWKKVKSFHIPSMKKEVFSKACAHLQKYYDLQEPYMITKCFDAADRKFQNRDVCLFVVGDELRITADLVHGFLHGERDLGCYAFKRDEITLSKQMNGTHLIAELRADNSIFLLGYRAKSFIDKNLLTFK